jgi:predicted GNAT family acetyltransferase
MTNPSPEPVVALDEARHRYDIKVQGEVAGFTQFFDHGGQRVFVHTEVGNEYAGQGLATILIASALDDVRTSGLRIVPLCPFVKKYLSRHHEYDDLVDPATPQLLARAGGK